MMNMPTSSRSCKVCTPYRKVYPLFHPINDTILADHDKILKEEQQKLKDMSEKHNQELKEIQGKLDTSKAQLTLGL